MNEIEDLQQKLSHVRRDFDNLLEDYRYHKKVLTEFIREIAKRVGVSEEDIDKEIEELLKPRPK